jgi:hypothetical protein
MLETIEELLMAEPRNIDNVLDIIEGLGFKVMIYAVSDRTGIQYTMYINIPIESEFDIIINIA